MKVVVFGGAGQVGRELARALAGYELVATTRSGSLPEGGACVPADFDHPDSLPDVLDAERPAVVVNAAAYTAVDRAECDADAAMRVNAHAPAAIAAWCAAHRATLVHYSTDYVFDGRGAVPYPEDAPTAPLSVYGATKLAGEAAIRASGAQHLIFRTAWVYAAHGSNFLRTMLRVGAERDELRVVADQFGTPTPAALIADVTARILERRHIAQSGTWHLTAAGETTWHGFAEAIFEEALAAGLLARAPRVLPIATAEYPTPAKRPAYSRLDISRLQRDFSLVLPEWRDGLRRVIGELVAQAPQSA